MYKASLFVFGKEYPIENARNCIITTPDLLGNRMAAAIKGDLRLLIKATSKINELLYQLVEFHEEIEGCIRFYQQNSSKKIYDLEFLGADLLSYHKKYHQKEGYLQGVEILIASQIQKVGEFIFDERKKIEQLPSEINTSIAHLQGYYFSCN